MNQNGCPPSIQTVQLRGNDLFYFTPTSKNIARAESLSHLNADALKLTLYIISRETKVELDCLFKIKYSEGILKPLSLGLVSRAGCGVFPCSQAIVI